MSSDQEPQAEEQEVAGTGGQPESQQQCPKCQAVVPVHAGYKTWCDQCGWNLEPQALLPPRTVFDRLYRSISERSSQRLFEEMKEGKSLKVTLTPARILAILLAGCVHGITAAFVVLGIWLCLLALPSSRSIGVIGLILGALCFVVAWMLLPSSPRVSASPLPRERYPTLYQTADQITQSLGSPPVDEIMYDVTYNASFGQFGWKRKRRLILGLPLFVILDGREKVALLSHELAHGVNGDPNRGLFLGTAIHSLAAWYSVIHPRNRWHVRAGLVSIFLLLINLISLLLAGIIWITAYILSHLLWRDTQRAEYLADLLAAEVSGTEAQLAVLDRLHLGQVFKVSLKLAYVKRRGDNFFAELQRRVTRVPRRELERIRRLEKLERSCIDTTHPPTAHRIEFLKAHYVPEAKVVLSPDQFAQLEQELSPLLQEVQKRIFALDELSFRELFGMSW